MTRDGTHGRQFARLIGSVCPGRTIPSTLKPKIPGIDTLHVWLLPLKAMGTYWASRKLAVRTMNRITVAFGRELRQTRNAARAQDFAVAVL